MLEVAGEFPEKTGEYHTYRYQSHDQKLGYIDIRYFEKLIEFYLYGQHFSNTIGLTNCRQ